MGRDRWREGLRTCKPGSVSRKDGTVTIYLAPRLTPGPAKRDGVAAVVKQPTRGRAGRSWSLYLALLQVGFDRRCVAAGGRALLPPDFTLTPLPRQRGGMFLCHFPSSAPDSSLAKAWALPSTLPGGARTFLPGCRCRPRGGHPVRLGLLCQSSRLDMAGQTERL